MQSKNIRDFSHERNQMCRCQVNNLKINDKYSALNKGAIIQENA